MSQLSLLPAIGALVEPLYCLSLWQPWAWCIMAGLKPVENRTWAPPKRLLGRPLVIHASKKWDRSGDAFCRALVPELPRREDLDYGAVIGLAVLRDVVSLDEWENPWFFGPIGWRLGATLKVEPIPLRGFQRLWKLDPETTARLENPVKLLRESVTGAAFR